MVTAADNMDKVVEGDVQKIEQAVERLLAYRRRVWRLMLTLVIVSFGYVFYRLYEMGILESLFWELYDNVKTIIHH